uniref:Uncharacterized protein n=1 Tax=Anguilla anguilla TaxID=7936 RepID=A0A0E9PP66_ANGAN
MVCVPSTKVCAGRAHPTESLVLFQVFDCHRKKRQ